MARRKKLKFKYGIYLWSIIFVIVGIIGTFKLGVVGKFISAIGIFPFGCFYIILPILLLVIGFIQVITGKKIDTFTFRSVGIYLFVIGVLVLMHLDFIPKGAFDSMSVFRNSFNQFISSYKEMVKYGALGNLFAPGGGLIGCVFGILFHAGLGRIGLITISWIFIVGGIILFTGFSIRDFLISASEAASKRVKNRESKDDKKEVIDDALLSNTKPIIHNANEIEEKKVINNINELKESNKEEVKKDNSSDIILDENYKLPPIDLLDKVKKNHNNVDSSGVEKNIAILERVLEDFGINGKVVEVHIGPTVAQYELEIARGIRVNKITSINREIALALSKKDVRIEAPIPGKSTVGVEFANDAPSSVTFREMMASSNMVNNPHKTLMVPLGKSIMGEVGVCEINKMPHMLIAGTTGSGKSVCVNGIICSILMRARPDEVRMVLVDPKVVEFSGYNGIPHLLCPVVTDPKRASMILQKMVNEMEVRYRKFADTGTKNIETYNDYIDKWNKNHKDDIKPRMPFIVIIIDELADLMMVAAKEVEDSILRITQKARAAGMHLIVATQRPSTEVITGLIKANIPSRIAFSVGSGIDSRTILDQVGAEKLLGKGDMLFLPIGSNSPLRIQGVYITDDEIKRVVDFTKDQQEAVYDDSLSNVEVNNSGEDSYSDDDSNDVDNMYDQVLEFVVSTQKASASLIQRKFKLGYNRAARIMDQLEERGIIGPSNGSKPRDVLVSYSDNNE